MGGEENMNEPRMGFSPENCTGNEIYFSWRLEDVGGIEVSIL